MTWSEDWQSRRGCGCGLGRACRGRGKAADSRGADRKPHTACDGLKSRRPSHASMPSSTRTPTASIVPAGSATSRARRGSWTWRATACSWRTIANSRAGCSPVVTATETPIPLRSHCAKRAKNPDSTWGRSTTPSSTSTCTGFRPGTGNLPTCTSTYAPRSGRARPVQGQPRIACPRVGPGGGARRPDRRGIGPAHGAQVSGAANRRRQVAKDPLEHPERTSLASTTGGI